MFGMNKNKTTPPLVRVSHDMEFPGFEEEIAMSMAEIGSAPLLDAGPVTANPSADECAAVASEAPEEAQKTKQSSNTQAALGAISAFEEQMRDAKPGFETIEFAVSNIRAAHDSFGRFLGSLRAAVLRVNELEEANAGFAADNRRLAHMLEQAKRQQSDQQTMAEATRRRIELLIMDYDEVKVGLGTAQLEAIEVNNALAEVETEKAALIYELATKSASLDRLLRENELLRQNNVNEKISYAGLEQRYAECERKLEEVSTLRKAEAVEMAELRLRVDNGEKEYRRLQKQSELAQVRLAETDERNMKLEADVEELTVRNTTMIEGFRSETEVLKAKLEISTRRNVADADEIVTLKQQLGVALASTDVAEIQLAWANGQLGAQRAAHDMQDAIVREPANDINGIGITSFDDKRRAANVSPAAVRSDPANGVRESKSRAKQRQS
jgi:chromosome segregation ATPase